MNNDPVSSLADLPDDTQSLVNEAEKALSTAYAPYSGFTVGAALRLDDGTIVTGSNQENASYPAGMCAERVALFTAASRYPGRAIRQIVVTARQKHGAPLHPVTPCGSCRQVLLEFENRQNKPFEVVLQIRKDEWITLPGAYSLLPYSFSKESFTPKPSEQ